MTRKDSIMIQLTNIIKECDSRELYKLLLELQNTSLLRGYAVATLSSFDNVIFVGCDDQIISEMIKSGESDRLFSEWLDKEL